VLQALWRTVPPTSSAVDPQLARRHLRIDSDYDDDLLQIYIGTAVDWAQNYLNRALIQQNYRWTIAHNEHQLPTWASANYTGYYGTGLFAGNYSGISNYGHGIELPRAPLRSVSSVIIGRPDSTDITLDPSEYSVDILSEPGRVHIPGHHFHHGFTNLQIAYSCGYGVDWTSIPPPILQALLLYVGFLYENRGDTDVAMPSACERLLTPYRVVVFG
jgi:hypothetical protein